MDQTPHEQLEQPRAANAAATSSPKRDDAKRPGRTTPEWRRLSSLFEKLPPHALEAEMSLLGSMLIDPKVIGDAILIVKNGEDFYNASHGVLFDAMVEIYDRNAALDIIQLNQLLVDRNLLKTIGGQDFLVELANAVPSAANANYYATLVREKALVRRLIDAAGEVLYEAYHSPEDASIILEQAEQRIFQIAEHAETSTMQSLQELIEETVQVLEANEGRSITGVATGYRDLDEMTGGLQHGEMIILAARPSMGKTALALNIAEQIAMTGTAVGVFSLEMGRQQLVQRLLCSSSGVDSQRLRRNMLNKDEWHHLHRACDTLMEAPLFIDDTPGLTMLQLRAKARRMAARHDIKAIVIDYLQLMTVGGRVESRQQEVSELSRSVKAMARELNVPVICLSQLNRAAEQREGHRPRMSDLRESGSIEQDADVVMMLHREEYYHRGDPMWAEENPDKVGVAELILTKQRNGPTGTVPLTWVGSSTRFRDHAHSSAPGGYYEHKPGNQNEAPPASDSAFSDRRPTGPVEDFRDGGGSDTNIPF